MYIENAELEAEHSYPVTGREMNAMARNSHNPLCRESCDHN